jgi:outer membrane protein TolC
VYLEQLIWNFGQTGALIKMEKFNLIAAEYQYIDCIHDVMNDIKVKYLDVLNAKAILEVAQKNVEINEKCVELTKKFFEENKKTKLDYINAEVCLSEAKVKLVEAENFYKKAFTDLCNAMYVPVTKEFTIGKIDTFDYHDVFFNPEFLKTPVGQWHNITKRPREGEIGRVQTLNESFDDLVEVAYKNCPTLKVLDATVKAMEQSLLYTKRKYYPKLSAYSGYKYDNRHRSRDSHYIDMQNHMFELGINLKSSVNVLKTKYEIDKAKLIVDDASNNLDIIKKNIYYDVQRCYLDVKTQEKQILNAESKLVKAQENIDYTLREYIDGRANYIELQIARQEYNNSKIDYVRQIYKYNISLAQLENTIHSNIDSVNKYAEQIIKMNTK